MPKLEYDETGRRIDKDPSKIWTGEKYIPKFRYIDGRLYEVADVSYSAYDVKGLKKEAELAKSRGEIAGYRIIDETLYISDTGPRRKVR